MVMADIPFTLRNGRSAVLGFVNDSDVSEMLNLLRVTAQETPFNGRSPEDCANLTEEDQCHWIREVAVSSNRVPFFCRVGDQLVGTCEVEFFAGQYRRHRASISLAVLGAYWGLGIGSQMMRTMLDIARARPGVKQVELDYFEYNVRARALYERYGFRIVGVLPDAMILPDGTILNEYRMVCRL